MKKLLTLLAFAFVAFTANAQSTQKGDVNGDGDVSVNDVAMIVNYILGVANDNFIAANADINGDGEIDINDVMGTVNIILGDDGGNGNGNGGGDTPSEPYYDLCPDNNHPHMIDLGLPSGLKWACCNVGATEPFEKGGYFAWGETEGHKLVYDTESYSYCYLDNIENILRFIFIGYDISGTQYDAAHVKWGGGWRMPTKAECDELANYYKGVYYLVWHGLPETENKPDQGRYFVGPNGKKLYFPHAAEQTGEWVEKPWSGNGYFGYSSCWTSTHDSPNDPYYQPGQSSYVFYSSTWGCGTGERWRVYGSTIRPVHP